MEILIVWMTIAAVVATGLVAGMFFGFSNFVMGALEKRPPAEGMAAMQSINVVVLNPVFLGVFIGAVALCGVVVLMAFLGGTLVMQGLTTAGMVFYAVGTVFLTGTKNVPLNNKLRDMAADTAEGQAFWRLYCRDWTRWNTVRTIAATLACGCFSYSLFLM